ncbi:virulence RhuM family protein [Aliarcobacter cryaerophilus]|uniref:virulence RhuM family protein n=1 Tax=Aliarcobacter cryaerophilus TaxID=28198 RepID=UPI00112F57AF|nr:virulence RhuM family protein [Aliarcobacter cryaerophilus]
MSKTSNNITIRSSAAEYLTFVASTNAINENIEVRYENENLWLTQKLISKLYGVEVNTINYHIKKIFADNELEESSTIRKFRIVQIEGSREVTRDVEHYNLSMIIAIGFKVDNEKAVQFRKWANNIVNEYTIKGFSMDDERLKNDGSILSKKYFEEQLERIREIRLSERKFYQKITDIYATSIDYDVTSTATKRFFATVQNKLHWAIHGQTAAEVVYNRADSKKENMGLSTWMDAPNGKIQKFDVTVAKNYLNDKELASLQRLVSAYLDLAEDMALREIPMTMLDWESRLNKFIEATDREILNDSGKISAEIAKAHALSEFEKYRVIQDKLYLSDFDKQIAILEIENKKSSENE